MIVIYSIKIRVIPRLVKLICIKWLEESAPTNLGKIPDIFCHRESGFGRVLLYAVTGAVGPVYASKQLFTELDFKRNE
jgi:hypothetical protein